MTSIFKENVRFSSLNDKEMKPTINETKPTINETKPTINETKPTINDRNDYSRDNYNRYQRNYTNIFADKRNIIKEEKPKLELIDANFPSIGQTTIKPSINTDMDYINLLTNSNNNEQNIIILTPTEKIDPGWLLIRRDKSTGKTMIKENPITYPEKNEYKLALNALASLYDERTNDYIAMWGYDEWDKMFRFQNYDYDYFNNLDELDNNEYELELQDEEYSDN